MSISFDKSYIRNSSYSVAMIVANSVVNDSRVLKTAFSLSKHGYRVNLFGLNTTSTMSNVEGYPFEVKLIANPRFAMKKKNAWWAEDGRYDIGLFIQNMVDGFLELIGKQQFDILHTHDMHGLPIGANLRERCDVGKMGWIHDIHEYVEGCTNLPDWLRFFLCEQEKKFISLPDSLTTVSPILARFVSETHNVSEPALVLNTPRITDYDDFNKRSIKSSLGLEKESPLMIYNGGVKPVRGVQYAVQALAYLPDIHLALLTNSTGTYMDDLHRLAKGCGAEGRLHVHPFVPNNEVTSFVRDATIGVNPVTIYENSDLALPNKVFEYIHAGLPIVSSATTMMKDFLGRNNCGRVFSAGDVQGLANAVKETLEVLPDGLPNVGQGSALAKRYCWEEQEKVLADEYDRLLSRSSGGTAAKTISPIGSVLQLPTHAANQPRSLASALARRGVEAKNAAFGSNGFGYAEDIALSSPSLRGDSIGTYLDEEGVGDFEAYHYHCRPLLYSKSFNFPTGGDLVFLKNNNKKVFFNFRGSEIRLQSIFKRATRFNYIDDQTSGHDENMPASFVEEDQRRFRDFVLGVCDHVFVNDPELQCYVPNSIIVPRAVDFSTLSSENPKGDDSIPLVVHAPSRMGVKGTRYVLDAIAQLRKEGLHFEFQLVQNMSHEDAMVVYRNASIIVDQLRIGWYGVLAVEGMALGKAVVSYVRHDLRHYLPYPPPLAYADPENIVNVLRFLILNPDAVERYGSSGKTFAREYHNADRIAESLIQIYSQPIKRVNSIAVSRFLTYQKTKAAPNGLTGRSRANQSREAPMRIRTLWNRLIRPRRKSFKKKTKRVSGNEVIEPVHEFLRYQRQGDVLLARGRTDKAFTCYERSLECYPQNFLLLSRMADYIIENPHEVRRSEVLDRAIEAILIRIGAGRTVFHLNDSISLLRRKLMRGMVGASHKFPALPCDDSVGVSGSAVSSKKRFVLLTCVWQRPALTAVFLDYYRRLQAELADRVELVLLAVGSEGKFSRDLCESHGFDYLEHPNSPLSDKWDFGLGRTREYDPDGVVIMGSDDFVTANLFSRYADLLDEGVLFMGLTDGYFFDLASRDSVIHWNGYGGLIGENGMPNRLGETIGMGRLLSAKLLEMLDYSIWGGLKIDRSLDRHMNRRLRSLGMLPVKYADKVPVEIDGKRYYYGQLGATMKDLGVAAVDIKSPDTSVTGMTSYLLSEHASKPLGDSNLFLKKQFSGDLASRIGILQQENGKQ